VALEFYISPAAMVSQKRLFCLIPDDTKLIAEFNKAINRAFKVAYDFKTYD